MIDLVGKFHIINRLNKQVIGLADLEVKGMSNAAFTHAGLITR